MRALLAKSLTIPNNLPTSPNISGEWRPGGGFEKSAIVLMVVAVLCGLILNPFSLMPGWLWTPFSQLLAKLSVWTGVVALISLIVLFTPAKLIHSLRSALWYQNFIRNLRLRRAPIFFAGMFCLLAVLVTNHYMFNIEDSFGSFCAATLPSNPIAAAEQAGIKQICYEKNPKKCPVDASIIDPVLGGACKSASADTAKCAGKEVVFDTRELCASTGVFVEKNGRYQLYVSQYAGTAPGPKFTAEQLNWRFAWMNSDFRGMTIAALGAYDDASCGERKAWEWLDFAASPLRASCNYAAARLRQLFGIIVFPLKRTLDRPPGNFILRYGPTGNEENLIDAEPPPASGAELDEPFTPTRDGELYVYLNKPALGVWPNVAYNLNSGIAKVTVIRIPPKH